MKNQEQWLRNLYKKLRTRFGHLDWWPGDGPFEISVGAILTQNTSWKNVEKAIGCLKEKNILDPKSILESNQCVLAETIRSSGYYNQKAIKLKNFSMFLQDKFNGSFRKMQKTPIDILRSDLLTVKGIGKETADSIILYAVELPIFVIDAYTRRILSRLSPSRFTESNSYDWYQDHFMNNLPHNLDLFNDFHAQLVKLGNNHCRKTPKCDDCPVKRNCSWRKRNS